MKAGRRNRRRELSRREFLASSAAAGGALGLPGLLAGCGSDDNPPLASTATPSSAVTPQPTATPTPVGHGQRVATMATAVETSRIWIQDCGILTMNEARDELSRGDILIENGRLVHVGAAIEPPPQNAEVIDGAGKLAMPGFVSAHHHLFQTLLRGFSPDQDLRGWLMTCIGPTSPHFEPEDLYWGARLTLAECIESGVTSIVDWSFNLHSAEHGAAVFEAMRDGGARVHFAYGPSMAKGFGDFDLRVKDFEAIRSRFFADPPTCDRITLWAGLGGPELQEPARFREEVDLARRYGHRIHIHVREHEDFEPRNAVEKLDEWGVLGPDLLLAHAIHLQNGDVERLAKSKTKVSYNALSNMRLADGICPVVELRERGVEVGLGLDGSASNDNNDYFALLRAAIGLQRAHWRKADCITVGDILDMATRVGARCVGQEAEVGSLETGKRADVILIDPRSLNFAPLNHFTAQLVFSAQPRNVDTVIIDGCILKRKRELVGVDTAELGAKCQAISRRLTERAGIRRREIVARP